MDLGGISELAMLRGELLSIAAAGDAGEEGGGGAIEEEDKEGDLRSVECGVDENA